MLARRTCHPLLRNNEPFMRVIAAGCEYSGVTTLLDGLPAPPTSPFSTAKSARACSKANLYVETNDPSSRST